MTTYIPWIIGALAIGGFVCWMLSKSEDMLEDEEGE